MSDEELRDVRNKPSHKDQQKNWTTKILSKCKKMIDWNNERLMKMK
jgi:hypothetical protein